ncbi:MAG: cobalt-precorrin-5B (C(1))-methyltransferase [Gemmataceae bacterium]
METPARENLRSGYTTGACAAAAGKGALLALLEQRVQDVVAIRLPAGQLVSFALHTCSFQSDAAAASVIKDAGDDPDVTDKAEIIVEVAWCEAAGVSFAGGPGVGLVTKKGLPVPPGEPAINPAPRKLIADTLEEVLDEHGRAGSGLRVTISVPGGAEMARKTFNPRLGITGGISILGTTGIVVPYSTTAWLASVTQEIDVAVAQGLRQLVLAVGERGERLARQLVTAPAEAFIQIGPFFGAALEHCARSGVTGVTLVAMIGKLAKFAAGNASVHSTSSRQDFAFLAELAVRAGADGERAARLRAANTAQEVAEEMQDSPLFFELLCQRARNFMRSFLNEEIDTAIVLIGASGQVLARDAC